MKNGIAGKDIQPLMPKLLSITRSVFEIIVFDQDLKMTKGCLTDQILEETLEASCQQTK